MGVLMRGQSAAAPFRFQVEHTPSGQTLETVAPKDNGGDGTSFSPTDLLATSLGVCACTVAELHARKTEIPLRSVSFSVEKEMAANPRRVGKLFLKIEFVGNFTQEQFESLVTAAKTCPVRLSLGEGCVVNETYSFRLG
jgi:putative redox protein